MISIHHQHKNLHFLVQRYPRSIFYFQTLSTQFLQEKNRPTSVKMDAIVQAILNLSKLEVSLIKIEDATPE